MKRLDVLSPLLSARTNFPSLGVILDTATPFAVALGIVADSP